MGFFFSFKPFPEARRATVLLLLNSCTQFILLLCVSAKSSNCIHHPKPLHSLLSIFIIALTGPKLLNLNDVGSGNMLSFIFPTENQCYTLAV